MFAPSPTRFEFTTTDCLIPEGKNIHFSLCIFKWPRLVWFIGRFAYQRLFLQNRTHDFSFNNKNEQPLAIQSMKQS